MPARSEVGNPVALKVQATWASVSRLAGVQTIIDENFKVETEPVKHDRTAVLLLHWEEKASDMDVSGELKNLQLVFEEDYQFEVRREAIVAKSYPRPEYQLRKALTTFIVEFDSPHTLYVIYYAGHGWGGDIAGNLNIASSTSQQAQSKLEVNSVVWNKAEQCLRETQSDILVVFDCCDAGALRVDHRGPYSFEFLGACDKGEYAPWPGKTSFTSAMIWALRELAKDRVGFDSAALRSKITQYEYFPHNKMNPVLFPRFRQGGAHVWIEPASHSDKSSANNSVAKHYPEETVDATTEWIDLRLYFNGDLSKEDIANLGKSLNKCAKKSGLRRVGVQDRSPDPRLVREQASIWVHKTFQGRISPTAARNNWKKPTEPPAVLLETAVEGEEKFDALIYSAMQCPSPLSGPAELQSSDIRKEGHVRRHSMSASETGHNRMANEQVPQAPQLPKRRPT